MSVQQGSVLSYQSIKTRNGQVGYCQIGNGQPLILVVGYSGTLYHWNRDFITELAQHYCVYMLDNRKVGLSDSHNEYSMLGMAQDVVDFIQAKALVRPLVFGWSMGGMITQTIMQQFPDLLGGAVLLATVPHANYTNPDFVDLVANSEHIPANEFRTKLYGMFFSRPPREELKELITQSAPAIHDYHYRFTFDAKELQDYAVMAWHGVDQQALALIKIPVLVLWARNDQVIPRSACEIFSNFIPDVKLIIYSDGGHFFLHANPRMIARDVINFFLG